MSDSVVQTAGDDQIIGEHHRGVGEYAGIAHVQSLLGLVLRPTTDVDEEFVELAGLAVARSILEMDRGGSDHALYLVFDTLDAGFESNSLPDDGARIDPADLPAVHESLVVDVVHHEADLVGMSAQGDRGRIWCRRTEPSEAVPVGVVPDVVRGRPNPVQPDLLAGGFRSGGGWGVEQSTQKGP